MPFAVIGIMIRGDKIGDKKRFILRFLLQFILFWTSISLFMCSRCSELV